MKRFVLALISVIGAGICGCNIDLAVDSDAAKCIKVGGIWDNKVCKKNPKDSQINDDYICKDKDLVVSENHGLITIGKCPVLCDGGKCNSCETCQKEEDEFVVSYCNDDEKFKLCPEDSACNVNGTDCEVTDFPSFCKKYKGNTYLCKKEQCFKCNDCENNICKDCDEDSVDNKKKQRCIDSKVEVCEKGVWVFARACQPDWICDENNYECSQVDDDGNGVTEDNDGNGGTEDNDDNGGTEDNDDNGNGDDKCNPDSDKFQCKNGSLQTCNEYGGWVKAGSETMCVDGTVYHCNGAEQPESAECAGTCDGNKCQSCEEAITQSSGEGTTWCNINNEGCNRASSVWNSGTYVACADNGECLENEKGCTTLNPDEACGKTGGILSPDGECICKVNGEFKNCGNEGCFATNACLPLKCKKLANFCFDGDSYQCKSDSGIDKLEKIECDELGCNSDTGTCFECLNNEIECLDSGKSSHYKICEDGKWSTVDIPYGTVCENNELVCQSYESLWKTINDDDEKCLLNEKMLQEIINRLKASNHNNNVKPQATFFIVSENQSYSFRVAAHIETDNYELYYSDDNAITSKDGKLNICDIGLPVDPYPDALLELKKSQISGIALLEFDADSEKCSTIVNIPKEEMSLICNNDESSKWTCNDNNVLMCANNKLYQLGFEGNDNYSWQSKSSIDYSEIDWDVSENIPWYNEHKEILETINEKLILNVKEYILNNYTSSSTGRGKASISVMYDNNNEYDCELENEASTENCTFKPLYYKILKISIKENGEIRESCETNNLTFSKLCYTPDIISNATACSFLASAL